jgi:hypothetical protein
MPADPTKVRDLAYFERHKHRVASGLNSIGQELWEANGLGRGPFGSGPFGSGPFGSRPFGKRSETATPETQVEDQEGS